MVTYTARFTAANNGSLIHRNIVYLSSDDHVWRKIATEDTHTPPADNSINVVIFVSSGGQQVSVAKTRVRQ